MTFLSDDDEWPDQSKKPTVRERGEQADFIRTGDYTFVALAIGEWASWNTFPAHPPEWALEACCALRERINFSSSPIIERRRGPGRNKLDDHLLEMIADIMLDKRVREKLGIRHSVRSATRYVLGLDPKVEDNADYRRLRILWVDEGDYRLKRAAARSYKRLKTQGLLPGQKV